MRIKAPAIGGSILGAGGIGYWLAAPAAIVSVLLGSSSACGCAPELSPFSDRWANCAIANAAIDGKLDVLFQGMDGTYSEEVPSKNRPISAAQSELLSSTVDKMCGAFELARSQDLELRIERRKASYQDLFVLGTFEDALGYSYTDSKYLAQVRDVKRLPSTKGSS